MAGIILVGLFFYSLGGWDDEDAATPPAPIPPGATQSSEPQPTTEASEPEVVVEEFQNEDYVLPPGSTSVSDIPFPRTVGEAIDWMETNPVYATTLAAPVRCEIPEDNVHVMDDAELERRMADYVECLTRVWGPALEEAGFESYLPEVIVYPSGGEIQTQCGTMPSYNAFYCSADQNLYLAADVAALMPRGLSSSQVLFDLVMAHEYGHAVQGRTGVLAASTALAYEADSRETSDMLMRRSEVQADCFAGQGIRSIGASLGIEEQDVADIQEITYEIGDDRLAERFRAEEAGADHGLGENRRLWTTRGLASGDVAACNTFMAPEEEVR